MAVMIVDDLGVMRWMVNKFWGFSMRGSGPQSLKITAYRIFPLRQHHPP